MLREREIVDALREQMTIDGLYRINVGHPDTVDREQMTKVWKEEGLISISSWGLDVDTVFSDAGAGVVNKHKFDESMHHDIQEGVDWDRVQEHFEHNPGLARGVHQTFCEDFDDETAVLANMWDGTAVGTVSGPARYDPNAPTRECDEVGHHVFTRRVKWARDQGGGVLTIENDTLPSSLHPLPRTLTQVNDFQQLMDLGQLVGFLAESGNKE